MIDHVLDLLAPHICCYCGQQNAILCENCYFDIKDEPYARCVVCLQPTAQSNICSRCRETSLLSEVWAVGDRAGSLKKLIDSYKFERVKQAGSTIARLVADRLPQLKSDTVICYIPDIAAHSRQRGYDHMAYVANRLGKLRGYTVRPLLHRQTHVSQRDLSRKERLTSQVGAFRVDGYPPSRVILLDDIYTTGATLQAGAAALRESGVETIYGVIVARQPLDEMHDL